jgi:hypothetical protein
MPRQIAGWSRQPVAGAFAPVDKTGVTVSPACRSLTDRNSRAESRSWYGGVRKQIGVVVIVSFLLYVVRPWPADHWLLEEERQHRLHPPSAPSS